MHCPTDEYASVSIPSDDLERALWRTSRCLYYADVLASVFDESCHVCIAGVLPSTPVFCYTGPSETKGPLFVTRRESRCLTIADDSMIVSISDDCAIVSASTSELYSSLVFCITE